MNIINSFTKRNMERNKKRTIVTIIGVMLSVALMCAVAGMAATFRDAMINYYETNFGSFYGVMDNIPIEHLPYIMDNAHVVRAGVSMPVGTASIKEAGANEQKYKDNTYINVMAFDDVAFEDVGLNLISGRLPENDTELLVNTMVMSDDWKVGDKITLNLGHRVLFDEDVSCNGMYLDNDYIKESLGLPEDEEITGDHIEDKVAREYTIVGVMESPNYMVQTYGNGGIICLTRMKDIDSFSAYKDTKAYTVNVYYTYDSARKYGDYTDDISSAIIDAARNSKENDAAENYVDMSGDDNDDDDIVDYAGNTELFVSDSLFGLRPGISAERNDIVKFYGGIGDTAATAVALLAAIIIAIIVLTSVFVISNSFRISVAEKKIQFGMLSSIGATKRQIKKIVLREGLYIWAAGTVLGILLGVMVVAILTVVVQKLAGGALKVAFRFVFPWWVIAIVIVMSAITIYFSCIIPARAASKISPIEAIRGNREIKLKGKKLKTLKITKKIFGVGGEIAAKNLKRSRRSYRTTVVSLVIGVATFIAIHSFIEYGKKITTLMYVDTNYDIRVMDYGVDLLRKFDDFKKFKQYDGVTDGGAVITVNGMVPKDYVDENLIDEYANADDEYTVYFMVYDRDYFAKYLDEIGVKTDDPSKAAVLQDDYLTMKEGNSYEKRNFIRDKKIDSIPVKIFAATEDLYTSEPVLEKDINITARSEERPLGLEGVNDFGAAYIIVSEDYFDNKIEPCISGVFAYLSSDTPDELFDTLNDKLRKDVSYKACFIQNIADDRNQMSKIILLVSIFLYGFIIVITLIGVTNIFNTIHTNMNMRAKEFAMLKSVGMTGREFNRMIRLESIMYGTRSLMIGIPLGLALSYAIYLAFSIEISFGYVFPAIPMIIAVIFVMIIVWMTMHFSLARIKKQNIIETIRKQTY